MRFVSFLPSDVGNLDSFCVSPCSAVRNNALLDHVSPVRNTHSIQRLSERASSLGVLPRIASHLPLEKTNKIPRIDGWTGFLTGQSCVVEYSKYQNNLSATIFDPEINRRSKRASFCSRVFPSSRSNNFPITNLNWHAKLLAEVSRHDTADNLGVLPSFSEQVPAKRSFNFA